jgi:hypothetical protein
MLSETDLLSMAAILTLLHESQLVLWEKKFLKMRMMKTLTQQIFHYSQLATIVVEAGDDAEVAEIFLRAI